MLDISGHAAKMLGGLMEQRDERQNE